MQNSTLPIQLTPSINTPAPRANAQATGDGAAFSQTLNREMAQRQSDAAKASKAADGPQPAVVQPKDAAVQPIKVGPGQEPAPKTPAASDAPVTAEADATDAPADQAAAAPALAPTTAAVVTTPTVAAAAATADDTAAAAAEGAAAVAPMADMLAMLASYKALTQSAAAPQTAAATATAAATEALATTRGNTAAADTQTLATLQNALKNADSAPGEATTGPVRATMRLPAENADAATPAKLDAKLEAKAETKADATAASPAVPAAVTTAASASAATARTAPDVAPAASRAAPQSDAALTALRDAAVTAAAKDTAPVTGSAFQAQLNSAATVQTAVTAASDNIPARLGTTAWDNQVSQKVVWMVGGADQTASLTLNPPDLGPVQVVLNVNNDQASVTFSSATPEVRAALENAMPHLRDMLSDAGVTLTQSNVNADMPDQRQAQAQAQADSNQNQGGSRNHGGNGRNNVRSGETEIALPASVSRVVRDNSNVDTFA